MQTTKELNRRPAPASRPFGLANFDGKLWTGSWDTERIYAIDPQSWTVTKELQAPGRPYGIVALGDELRVVIAHGEEDDRYFYRLTPEGFDLGSKTPCPDLTGSFMTTAGSTIYLGQMHYRRILILKPDYTIERQVALPTRSAGFAFGPDGRFYLISADEEFENLQLGTLDVSQESPEFESLLPMPETARNLFYDGAKWWTCLRDDNEIATFKL